MPIITSRFSLRSMPSNENLYSNADVVQPMLEEKGSSSQRLRLDFSLALMVLLPMLRR